MKPDNKCPKCGGEFETGIIADQTRNGVINARWVTRIQGTFFPRLENKKNIASMRCRNCGYLENYTN